jgi:hypothetical protein
MKIFCIGDEAIGIDKEKVSWIERTFKKENYKIYHRDGFLIDEYLVRFERDSDAILYELKWK